MFCLRFYLSFCARHHRHCSGHPTCAWSISDALHGEVGGNASPSLRGAFRFASLRFFSLGFFYDIKKLFASFEFLLLDFIIKKVHYHYRMRENEVLTKFMQQKNISKPSTHIKRLDFSFIHTARIFTSCPYLVDRFSQCVFETTPPGFEPGWPDSQPRVPTDWVVRTNHR